MTLTLKQLEINTVIHHAVWVIIQTDLPILLDRVRELLATAEEFPPEPA